MPVNHQLENARYQHGGRRNLCSRQGVKALSEGSGASRLAVSHNQACGDTGLVCEYQDRVSSCGCSDLIQRTCQLSRVHYKLNPLSICVQSPYYTHNGYMASTELEPESRVQSQVHLSGLRRL